MRRFGEGSCSEIVGLRLAILLDGEMQVAGSLGVLQG